MMLIADSMNAIFEQMYKKIISEGHKKHGTTELNNAMFVLTNVENNIVGYSNIDLGYLCAEELWYSNGDEKLGFINQFNAPGFKRTSEDGIYSNSAYGHIIFKRHGFNQLNQVIDILKKDPDSRRAVINLNVPNPHRQTCFDEICTFNLAFYINDNKLYCTAMMRSNDFCGCMPYDVAFFTSLQKYIAHKLEIECGTYTHFATSLHIYDKNLYWNFNEKPKNYIFDFLSHHMSRLYLSRLFEEKLKCLDKTDKDSCNYNEILLDLYKENKIIYEVE